MTELTAEEPGRPRPSWGKSAQGRGEWPLVAPWEKAKSNEEASARASCLWGVNPDLREGASGKSQASVGLLWELGTGKVGARLGRPVTSAAGGQHQA